MAKLEIKEIAPMDLYCRLTAAPRGRGHDERAADCKASIGA